LRFVLTNGCGWRARTREGDWREVDPVALFGPSSGVTWSESARGLVVGIGLLPRGWNRLSRDPAVVWADRVGPGALAIPGDLGGLHRRLCEAREDDEVPALFDAFLLSAIRPGTPADAAIARVEAALVDPNLTTVGQLAASVGLSTRSLERLAARAFGFSPKLLMRRARFLRSLHAIRTLPPAARASGIDPAYSDYSHFVRDAQDFLGMSPKAFLEMDNPLLKQSLALRDAVLGAPAQALSKS
jgi:AraC-like DNA-binding protein